jgi:hypothetical protein
MVGPGRCSQDGRYLTLGSAPNLLVTAQPEY